MPPTSGFTAGRLTPPRDLGVRNRALLPAEVKQSLDRGGSALLPQLLLDGLPHETRDDGAFVLIRERLLKGLLDLVQSLAWLV